jgi:hypothetical protein
MISDSDSDSDHEKRFGKDKNATLVLRNLVRIHVPMPVDPKDTGQSRRARGTKSAPRPPDALRAN